MKKYFILPLLVSALLFSCKKDEKKNDPAPEAENEIITTVIIEFKDSVSNTSTVYQWENLGGYGLGSTSTVDTIKLSAAKTYLASVLLLNKTNPAAVDTISNEVLEEGVDHLFCFSPTGTSATVIKTDLDANSLPIGLQSKWRTTSTGLGTMQVELRHQPGIKDGSCTPGDTDIDVVFQTKIQ